MEVLAAFIIALPLHLIAQELSRIAGALRKLSDKENKS